MQRFIFLFILGLVYANNFEIPEGLIPKDDIEKIVKTKCEQNGGAEAYTNLQTAGVKLKECLQGLGNASVFHEELEEAKKTGSMDEVFGKYCAKTPQVKECVRNFRTNLEPCLEAAEKSALNTTLDIARKLGEFLCYKDGDRLAMFIAEGGVECLQSQREAIKNCANATYFNKVSSQVGSNSLGSFLMDTDKCSDFEKLRDCVVSEMEKCSDSTPANIIEALFKFIYRNTCKNRSKRSLLMHKLELVRELGATLGRHRRDASSSSSSSSDCSGGKDKKREGLEERKEKKKESSSSSSSSSSSEEDDKNKRENRVECIRRKECVP